jgi:hypothetical protein
MTLAPTESENDEESGSREEGLNEIFEHEPMID